MLPRIRIATAANTKEKFELQQLGSHPEQPGTQKRPGKDAHELA